MIDVDGILDWLRPRLVPGVESVRAATADAPAAYARTLRDPRDPNHVGVLRLLLTDAPRVETEWSTAPGAVIDAMRRVVPDADPEARGRLEFVARTHDAAGLGALLPQLPFAQVGTADPHEMLVRAIVGQQITVAQATSQLAALALLAGEPPVDDALTRVFPSPAQIAEGAGSVLKGPRARIDTVIRATAAIASGELVLAHDVDLVQLRADLLALKGIGPWTADYVLLRLGDPDVHLPGDVAVRRGAALLGILDLDAAAASCVGSRSALTIACWGAASGRGLSTTS